MESKAYKIFVNSTLHAKVEDRNRALSYLGEKLGPVKYNRLMQSGKIKWGKTKAEVKSHEAFDENK